jgi:hypothetical protein
MKRLVLVLLLISLTACKYDGTDTGNPSAEAGMPDCNGKQRCLPNPYIKSQVGNICNKLGSCFDIDTKSCHMPVYAQTGLAKEITLQVDTFQQVDELYEQKKLDINADNYGTCMRAISALSCDASIVQNAVSGDPVDYSNVHLLLQADSSCKEIYSLIDPK